MKTKVVFFGNEQLAQGVKASPFIFNALVDSNDFDVCALILTTPNHRKPYPIEKAAKAANIPVYFSTNNDEIIDIIKKYDAPVAILASFGKIIPNRIINAFPCGIINIHPSLLPKYRGTTPIETALLNNDPETGTSIMRLAEKMDAGPILAQKRLAIAPDDTKQSLYEKLAKISADELLRVLPAIVAKNAPETAQNETQAIFTAKLTKELSAFEPASKTAQTLSNEIRAYAGFPKTKATLLDIPCTITVAHVANKPSTPLDQRCADGNYLIIDRLIPENSKEMDAVSFLNGHKK